MIYWAKFEGKLFFDPECIGPLLQTLPLKTRKKMRQAKNNPIMHKIQLKLTKKGSIL